MNFRHKIIIALFALLSIVNNVVLAASKCTVNGKEIPCEQVAKTAGKAIGLGIGFIALFAVIGTAFFIFWIMMLIHAISKPIENKGMWVVLLIFTGIIGALIYYFMVKRNFIEQPVSQAIPPMTPPSNPAQ